MVMVTTAERLNVFLNQCMKSTMEDHVMHHSTWPYSVSFKFLKFFEWGGGGGGGSTHDDQLGCR